MKASVMALLSVATLIGACSSSNDSDSTPIDPQNPNLPTGQPADDDITEDGSLIPELQPVSASIPEAQRLSVGGFDSTSSEWESLRRGLGIFNTSNICGDLMAAMITERGAPEESSADSIAPQTWWYWTQGYTVTFDWNGSQCLAEDYRFTPQF